MRQGDAARSESVVLGPPRGQATISSVIVGRPRSKVDEDDG
jgi:hypothetical protein